MTRYVLVSLSLHVLLLCAGFTYSRRPHAWKRPPMIYQVELVRPPVEETEASRETTVPVTPPEPEEILQPVSEVKQAPPPPKNETETRAIASEDSVKRASASAADIRVDGEPFPHDYYLKLLHKKIRENWRPPPEAGAPGRLSATVRFRILRNGKIETVVLERSAGRLLYDRAAQRAIYGIGKLPPLPLEFEGDFLNLHIEFETRR